MRKPQRPDPPHILDYMARIKIEGIDVRKTAEERMILWRNSRSLVA